MVNYCDLSYSFSPWHLHVNSWLLSSLLRVGLMHTPAEEKEV